MPPPNQSTIISYPAKKAAPNFNNILTACLELSELLLSFLPKNDPIREDIEDKKRAVHLIRPFFTFHPPLHLEQKVIDLNDVIVNSQKLLQRIIGSNIQIVIVPSVDSINIRSNPEQIEQVLLNLAVNARDAMPFGGTIIIETAIADLMKTSNEMKNIAVPAGKYVKLSVRYIGGNNGKETRISHYGSTYQTMTGLQETNLGLATVYRIVKQKRGDIHIRTEKEKGTTITIYLPKADVPAECSYQDPWIEYSFKNNPSYIFNGIL